MNILISMVAGGVAGGVISRIMIGVFLKKVENLDEIYRKKLINIASDAIEKCTQAKA